MLISCIFLACSGLVWYKSEEISKRIGDARNRIRETINHLNSKIESTFEESLFFQKSTRKSVMMGRKLFQNISWKLVTEFLVLKIRANAATYLETGLLTRPCSNFYDLVYYDGINRYTVRFPKVRGPGKISRIVSENDDDVTKELERYLGPSHNFHGIPTRPDFFGYEKLTFFLRDGSEKTFSRTDQIIL